MIKKLAIFGVGLIGGSLALSLRRSNACETIVGCSRSEANLTRALELGVINQYTLDPVEAIKDADMILLAVPLGAMHPILKAISKHIEPDAVITDAGSSKASVVAAAKKAFGTVPSNFVPGHPIAGREKSGVDAAIDDLFVDHKVILTPLPQTSDEAVLRVKKMWESVGAEVRTLDVDQHDKVLAATSHLPHVVAYSLVDTISRTDCVDQIFQFAAGGFRDSSRTASSDPVMWRDICLENRSAILDSLTSFQDNLANLRALIEASDGDELLKIFSRAKKVRDENVMKHKPARKIAGD